MKRRALLALAVIALTGCGGDPPPAARADAADSVARTDAAAKVRHEEGRRIYNFRCYFCHGYSGDAATVAASHLEPRPRDFQSARADDLVGERILAAVRHGRPGTAMKSFSKILSESEMGAVAEFVREEFVVGKRANTRYHTAENGWPGHERHRAAFPFARGEIDPAAPVENLGAAAAAGRQLFMSACVSCHDRGSGGKDATVFALRSVSYPPFNYTRDEEGEGDQHHHESADPDDPYEKHEKAPALAGLSSGERRGERIFQKNCAYCHAADGTGRNWIGAFIDPPPRDFTAPEVRARFAPERLRRLIRDGIDGTSMPAWGGVLRRGEIDDVTAYMSRAFRDSAQTATRRHEVARQH